MLHAWYCFWVYNVITPKHDAEGNRRMKMNDAQAIVETMMADGLDYHVINDTLLIAEFNGEYWLVDASAEVDLDKMPMLMRLR
jgi:hypothetical protein